MAPLIPSQSFILATKWLAWLPISAGQQLVMNHAKYGIIVKTVMLVENNGAIWSKGENTKSVSVEQMGPINKQQILGRVIHVFKPNDAA